MVLHRFDMFLGMARRCAICSTESEMLLAASALQETISRYNVPHTILLSFNQLM
jgi:hypothetical protein